MDDWPRVSYMYNSKYSIDASSWMHFFSSKMGYIAEKINLSQKSKEYYEKSEKIK